MRSIQRTASWKVVAPLLLTFAFASFESLIPVAAGDVLNVPMDTTWRGIGPEGNSVGGSIHGVGHAFESANPTWNISTSYDDSAPAGWNDIVETSPGKFWVDGAGLHGSTPSYYRKKFTIGGAPTSGQFNLSIDDDAVVYVNGTQVLSDADGLSNAFHNVDVTSALSPGENLIAIKAHDIGYLEWLNFGLDLEFSPATITPANASFSGVADNDVLSIDFGSVAFGGPTPAGLGFDIFNLFGAGVQARLELLSASGSGDTSQLSTDLAPFANLAPDDSLPFVASFDTSALGDFSSSYTLNLTDTIGTTQTLTLNLSGEVVLPANDPSIPDLVYNAATGEVILDPDASSIIGYVLKNTTSGFLAGGHTPILGGVSTSVSSEISEASFSSPTTPTSIGMVFPTGMDFTELFNFLSTNEVSRSFGSPLVPFDLIVIGDSQAVPEPSTYAMAAIGLFGLGLIARRRSSGRQRSHASAAEGKEPWQSTCQWHQVLALACLLALLMQSNTAQAITFDWATVGDAGNVDDIYHHGFGEVNYEYRISKHEVTNAQYVEFLNDVAVSDPYSLYHPDMTSHTWGGVIRSGSPGTYAYSVKADAVGQGPDGSDYAYASKPVTYVSWYDTIRFVNWLTRGTTESGTYAITDGGANSGTVSFPDHSKLVPGQHFLPTLDEWYKAAYYDGVRGIYFDFPTATDMVPNTNLPSADTGNSVNINKATGDTNYPLTDVGAYGLSASPYGTFDQGGNAREWNESPQLGGATRGVGGGYWGDDLGSTRAGRISSLEPSRGGGATGFRIVSSVETVVSYPEIPDLVYNATTGEVILDPDGATGIIGYTLKNTTSSFLAGNFTAILGGLATSSTIEISEANFSAITSSASIGNVFPTGLDYLGLYELLSDHSVSTGLGGDLVPFDLIVIGDTPAVPEPSTYAMAVIGIVGIAVFGRRRLRLTNPTRERGTRPENSTLHRRQTGTGEASGPRRRTGKSFVSALSAVFVLVLLSQTNTANAVTFNVTQLSSTHPVASKPQLSGNHVIWQVWDGNDSEINFFNGVTTTQLTNNSSRDDYPQISGNNIVWQGFDGNDWEIFLYDGVSTTQLTNNNFDDFRPQVSGDNVVWRGQSGINRDVFYFDGVTTTQLTSNAAVLSPQIAGDNIVWSDVVDLDIEVFLFDGVTTTQITNGNGIEDWYPQVSSNGNVVWQANVNKESAADVMLYDGTTTSILGAHSIHDPVAEIWGDNVVWSSGGEIFLHDGTTTAQLTNNGFLDGYPQVSGDNVVWSGNGEIFLFDGLSTTQLTDDGFNNVDLSISGSNIAWRQQGGPVNAIFLATSVPEPSTYAMAVMGLLGLGLYGWRRRRSR